MLPGEQKAGEKPIERLKGAENSRDRAAPGPRGPVSPLRLTPAAFEGQRWRCININPAAADFIQGVFGLDSAPEPFRLLMVVTLDFSRRYQTRVCSAVPELWALPGRYATGTYSSQKSLFFWMVYVKNDLSILCLFVLGKMSDGFSVSMACFKKKKKAGAVILIALKWGPSAGGGSAALLTQRNSPNPPPLHRHLLVFWKPQPRHSIPPPSTLFGSS